MSNIFLILLLLIIGPPVVVLTVFYSVKLGTYAWLRARLLFDLEQKKENKANEPGNI